MQEKRAFFWYKLRKTMCFVCLFCTLRVLTALVFLFDFEKGYCYCCCCCWCLLCVQHTPTTKKTQ